MQNSVVMFIYFRFQLKVPFLDKFGPKIQNWLFKVKFGTQTNLNRQNLMVMFTFFVFNEKLPFWANLLPKFKIIFVK